MRVADLAGIDLLGNPVFISKLKMGHAARTSLEVPETLPRSFAPRQNLDMGLEVNIYDVITLWLAVGAAIYYDRRHRESMMVWRVSRFVGLVAAITLWGYVTLRVLVQP